MDHFFPAQKAQDSLNFITMVTFDPFRIGSGIGAQTAPQGGTIGALHHHGITTLKISRNLYHACGQQALASAQGLNRTGINGDGTIGS